MEHSFCGPSKDKVHFSMKDFLGIGNNLCFTFYKFYCKWKKGEKGSLEIEMFKDLYSNRELLKVGDNDDADSSSDE